MDDHEIVPSQYWLYSNGISSSDFRNIFDPGLGYVKNKIISNLEYSLKDTLDIFVYLSGEGTTINGDKVLLPFDADKSKSTSFYKVKDLYSDLEAIQSMPDVGNVTLFMDVDFNNSSFAQNLVKASEEPEEGKEKEKRRKRRKRRKKVNLKNL